MNNENEDKKDTMMHNYVLIRCSDPSDTGHMKVEMEYECDETLAAYLVNSASQRFL